MESKIDLSGLFKSDEEFNKVYNALCKKVKKYDKYRDRLFSSPEVLYEFLSFDTDFMKDLERVYKYAHINNDLDLTVAKYQEFFGKAVKLYNEKIAKCSYVAPELLEHDYKEFLDFCKKYPKLNEYKLNMKSVFRNKKLVKSKAEEELISLLISNDDRIGDISEILISADLKYGTIIDEDGKEVELTNSNYSTYLESKDRNVRKAAFEAMYREIGAHENVFAVILGTEIMNNNRIAKMRKFKSARELTLYENEINNEIYDSLIEGVHKNLPKFYKFYDFKKKVMGLKDFHLYDTYATITDKYSKKYSYEEAKDVVLKSLSVLGEDYVTVLQRAFNENWIDSRLIKGKKSGAYCTCAYVTHPYVVMSYEEKLDNVLTLAHELGHAMHFYYAQTNNSYQDYWYSLFVAEVASQVNEMLLMDYLLENSTDKEEKKYILDTILGRLKSNIIRQTMFAEFEDLMHKKENTGEVLTKEFMTSEYYKLNKLYFGDGVVVDEQIKNECFRIPHFFYKFYVYQYATGYAAAIKIAGDILSGKEGALDKYLKFLKLGSTKDPVSSLKVAGVDMTDSAIYTEVFDVFEKRLDELRSLYE